MLLLVHYFHFPMIGMFGRWLREEKQLRRIASASKEGKGGDKPSLKLASWSNGWAPGRLTSTLKDSSNAVLRM